MSAPTTTLTIPDIRDDATNLEAALAYAECGLYILPVKRGTKHAGNVVGKHWQTKSSRDPKQITAWFAATDHDIAWHVGRSGGLVVDTDHPDKLPDLLRKHLPTAPYQPTRLNTPGRGHYVFSQPPGRTIGNGAGRLRGGWGELRGLNGIIKVFPSVHADPHGRYGPWQRTGPAPVFPDELSELVDDASPAEDAATDAAVAAFLAEHTGNARPEVLAGLVSVLAERFADRESRHESTVPVMAGVMKEARLGLYPAQHAVDVIRPMFLTEVAKEPTSDKQGAARNGKAAASEFDGILSWAIGQANAADLDKVRARVDEHMPDNTSVTEVGAETINGESTTDDNTEPVSLDEAHKTFHHWLGADYDTDALDATLAAAAVEKFDDGSDPIWLLLISGPGNAKTETVQALAGINAKMTSSISSDAALLSGTPKRDRAKNPTGGLLRRMGDRGVLVIKDVTSILAMNTDARGRVLAALREVYDGRWDREVGADGGRFITWSGRIVVIGAVTTAWDTAHSVIATMGDRFALIRIDSTKARMASGRQAIGNTGDEATMRAQLSAAVGGVIAGMNTDPITVTDTETETLLKAADLVTLARTGVAYDYRGNVIDAHAPEVPTRFAKQLTQIIRGGVAIGMDRADALRLAIRCARDSMPPLRLAIIDDLAVYPDSTPTEVRKRLGKPRATVDRQLQALHILGVLRLDERSVGYVIELEADEDWADDHSKRSRVKWHYSLADGIDPTALIPPKIPPKLVPEKSPHTPSPQEKGSEREETEGEDSTCTDFSGTNSPDNGRAAQQTMCPACQRAPARTDSGLCDFCTIKRQRQTDGVA